MKTGDCRCEKCRALCLGAPGWFLPGEAEKAAAHLGLPFPEFIARFCTVDFWEASDNIHALSPGKVCFDTGDVAGYDDAFYASPCTLLGPEGCLLSSDTRPQECRVVYACEPTGGPSNEVRETVIMPAWKALGPNAAVDLLHSLKVESMRARDPNNRKSETAAFFRAIREKLKEQGQIVITGDSTMRPLMRPEGQVCMKGSPDPKAKYHDGAEEVSTVVGRDGDRTKYRCADCGAEWEA